MAVPGDKFTLTQEAMRETFGRLNAELFGGQLATIPLRMSNAVKRGGTYRAKAEFVQPNPRMRRLLRDHRIKNLRDESITISRKICPTQEMLDRFMAHEMVHQWQSEVMGVSEDSGGHGNLFLQKAEEINSVKGPGFVAVSSDVVAGETSGKEGQVYHVVLFERGGRKLGGFSRRPFGEKEMGIIEQTARRMGVEYRILATTSHDAQVLLDMSRVRPGARGRSWPVLPADIYESIMSGETPSVSAALRSARLRIADLRGVTLYHGTSLGTVADIVREGVRSFRGDQWSGNPSIVNAGTDAIYLTPDFELAVRYAKGLAGDRPPAVLECRVSGRHMKKLRTDPMDTWEGAWDEDGNSYSEPPEHQSELDSLRSDVEDFLRRNGVRVPYGAFFPDDFDRYDGLSLYKLALGHMRKSAPDGARETFRRFRGEFPPGDRGSFHIRPDGTVRLDSSYWEAAHQLQYSRGKPTRLPPAAIKAAWVPAEMAPPGSETQEVRPRNLPCESKEKFDEEARAYESVPEWCDALAEAKDAEDIEFIRVNDRYVEDIGDDDPEPLLAVREVAKEMLESPGEDHSQRIRELRDEYGGFYDPYDDWGGETYCEPVSLAKVPLDFLAQTVSAATALRRAAMEVAASSGTMVAYHATLSGSDILRDGFKRSDEVERVGLGGSSTGGSVSFTTDWGVATGIHKSFAMMHGLVNADDPLAAMKGHFESLDPGVAEAVLEYWKSADGGDLKELLGGWKPRPYGARMQTYDQLVQQGFKPTHAAGDEGGEGGTLYYQWLEPVTAADAERMVYTYVKVYFYANRDEYNPVFMGGDASHFKGIPRDDIGVFTVELHVDPSRKQKNHGDLYRSPGYAILPAESEYRVSDMSMVGDVLDYDTHPGDAPKVRGEERSYHADPEVEGAVNGLLSLLARHRALLGRGGKLDVRQAMAVLRNADDMRAVGEAAGTIMSVTGLRGMERAIRSVADLSGRMQPSETARKAVAALPDSVREEVSGAPDTARFADISERWYDADEAAYVAWVDALGGMDIGESAAEREIDDWISDSRYRERLQEEIEWVRREIPEFAEDEAGAYLELAERLSDPARSRSAMLKVALRTVYEAGDPSKARHFILRRGKLWLWGGIDLGGADEARLVESIREEFGTDRPPFDQKFPIDNQYRVRDMFEPTGLFGPASDEDMTRFRGLASDTLYGMVLPGGTLRAKTVAGLPVHADHPELGKLLKHLGVEAERPQPKGVWHHGFTATPERMAGVGRFGLRPGEVVGESNWDRNDEYDRSLVYLTTDEMNAKGHACGRNESKYPYAAVVAVREENLDRTRMEADFDAERGGFEPNRAGLVGYRGRIPAAAFDWVKIYRNGYNQESTPLLLTLGPDEFGALAKEYAEWAERTKADREALDREQMYGPSFTDHGRVRELMDRIDKDPIRRAVDSAKADAPRAVAASLRAAGSRIREALHDDQLPPMLYHATPRENVESILRSGIVPRDESATVGSDGIHPGRVFLSRFDDPSYMNLPADKIVDAVVLAVDTSFLDPSRFYPDDSIYAAYFNDQLVDGELRAMFPGYYRRWVESGSPAGDDAFSEWMDENGPDDDELERLLAGRFGLTLWGLGEADALGEVGYEGGIPSEAIAAHKRASGQYLYHCTLADYLLDIAEHGLDPAHGGTNFSGGPDDPPGWVEGKLFFADSEQRALYFGENAMVKLWKFRKTPPVMLRVPIAAVRVQPDRYGDFYTEDTVSPSLIEVKAPTGFESGSPLAWEPLTEELAEEARDVFSDYLGQDEPLLRAPDFSADDKLPRALASARARLARGDRRVELTENDYGGVSAFVIDADGEQTDEAYGDMHMGSPDEFQGDEAGRDHFHGDEPIEEDGPVAILTGIELPEGMRGAGLGRRMVEEMSRWVFARGAQAVYTHAVGSPGDPDPTGFYETLGFHDVGMDPLGNLYMKLDRPGRQAGRKSPFRAALEAAVDAAGMSGEIEVTSGGGWVYLNRKHDTARMSKVFAAKAKKSHLWVTMFEAPVRGEGAGRAFVAKLEEIARSAGIPLIKGEALHGSEGFWEAVGFEETGIRRTDPDDEFPYHRIRKVLARARLRLTAANYYDFAHGKDDDIVMWQFDDGRLRTLPAKGGDNHDDMFPMGPSVVAQGRVMGDLGSASFYAVDDAVDERDQRRAVEALVGRFPGVRFTVWPTWAMRSPMTLQQFWQSLSRAASREPAFLDRLRDAGAIPPDADAAVAAVMSGTLIHNAAGSAGGDPEEKVRSILESGIDPGRWVRPSPGQAWSGHPKAAYLSLAWDGALESPPPNYVFAEPRLSKPLVLWCFDADGNYVWGKALQEATGKSGQALTSLLRRHGYDSVVTVRQGGEVGEIAYFGESPLPAFLPEPSDRTAHALAAAAEITRRAALGDIFRGVQTVIDKHGGKGLFARFSDVPKIGIRPSTEHHDPYGVYFYPVDWLAENAGWGTTYANLPYITVARIRRSGWLNLATVRPAKARELAEKGGVLEEYDARTSGKGLNQAKGGRAGKRLWDAVEDKVKPFESESNKMEWNRIFGRMGVKAIYDPGTGTVNDREPSQIVVLDLSLIDVVDMVENKEDRKSVFHAVLKAVADDVLDEGWRVAGSHSEGGIWAAGAVGGAPVELSVMPARGGFKVEVALSYHDPSGKKHRIVSKGEMPSEWEYASAAYLSEQHAKSIKRGLTSAELGTGGAEDAEDMLDAALRTFTNLRLPDLTVTEEGEGVSFWRNTGDGKVEGSLKAAGDRRELELYAEDWLRFAGDESSVIEVGPMRISWEGDPSSAKAAFAAELSRAVRELRVTDGEGKLNEGINRGAAEEILRMRTLSWTFPEDILDAAGLPKRKKTATAACPYGDYRTFTPSPGGVRMPPRITPRLHGDVQELFSGACMCDRCQADAASGAPRVARALSAALSGLGMRESGKPRKAAQGPPEGLHGPLRAWHGTSDAYLPLIRESGGLESPFLAATPELAGYYADVVAEDDGGEPVVVEVSVSDTSRLRYDGAAMDEPVTVGVDEAGRDAEWGRAEEEHPEWVHGGTISIPPEEWEYSWRGAHSVRHDGLLPLADIRLASAPAKEFWRMTRREFMHPKFDVRALDRIANGREGERVGTLGDYFRGEKIRALYAPVLDTPVMVINSPVEGGRRKEMPEGYEFKGALGTFRGEMTIFLPSGTINGLINALLEEGAHAMRESKGRETPKTSVDDWDWDEYEALPHERSAAAMSKHALSLKEKDHRELVEEALAAGLPVPPEVLADYPELTVAASAPVLEMVESETPAQAAALAEMFGRSREDFLRWAGEDDADADSYWFAEWLGESGVSVRDDGLVEFETLDGDTARLIGDLPVVVYHHTSDAVLSSVRSEGLRPDDDVDVSRHGEPCLGVYVTTEASGPAVDGYLHRACAVHGGAPATLEVRTTLGQLATDENDADIASGARQFALPYVAPRDILGLEKSALNGAGRHYHGTVRAGRIRFGELPAAVRADVADNLHDALFADTDVGPELLLEVLADMDTPLPAGRLPVAALAAQARATHSVSDAAVAALAAALRGSADLDPVLTDGDRFLDGAHRVMAYEAEGRETIPAVDVSPLLAADWEAELREEIPGLLRRAPAKVARCRMVTFGDLRRRAKAEYPRAGDTVDGRRVLPDVPNTSSISASFGEWDELPGIREVPMSDFGGPETALYAADDFRRSRELAARIRESGEISPLIVAVDDEGPYILEGGHRFVALHGLGARSFPAVVVVDMDERPDDGGERDDVRGEDGAVASALSRAARALGEHLGETVSAYRALGAEHMEKVMREGFTGEHHRHGVYYTANWERAAFYARFMPKGRWGVIFELEADTSRSTADVNDATESQSEELFGEVRSAAGDMADAIHRNTGARLWDGDAARQLESWLGGLTVSEGFYESPEQHSVWQLIADETKGTDDEMTPAEAREALPPGRYGEMTVLDSRGVAGVDAGEMSGQAQAVSSGGVPAERLTAVWLPSGLLEAAGEAAPDGAETRHDTVDVIPAKLDPEDDLVAEIERQRDAALARAEEPDPEGDAEGQRMMPWGEERPVWGGAEDAEELASMLGGLLERDEGDSTMSGHVYSKLDRGEDVTQEDFDREEGLVRYPLPGGRLRAVKAVRKALAAEAGGKATGRAARRAAEQLTKGSDMRRADAIARALQRAAETVADWSEESDVDPGDFQDEGFVQDDSGHEFWGSKGSGCLFVRNHPDEGPQLLAVLRSPQVEEPNTWGTTGGAIPQGETNDFASAIRETREEIGSIPQYKGVQKYVWKATGGTFTYTTFILECLDMDWLPATFNWEATDAKWVSLDEASSLNLHFGLVSILNDLGEGIFPSAAE